MDLEPAFVALKREFDRYISLTSDEWNDVRSRWHVRTFKKNELITAEGDVEKYFYFIIEGVHRLYFMDRKEVDQTVAFGYHPNFSGNFYSLCTRKPSDYFVEALSSGSMLALPARDLDELYDAYPIMDRWGRLLYQDFLAGRGKREREMLTMTAQERFERLCRESPHMLQYVPHKHLASYIGMRPETFSRMWQRI